ncbi:MAG TPA: phosphatidylserine decarboxylase family protein [Bacteroidia bacterium]|jgi:phosphatidylserine decarboxylase|nr:phosphatidylserine decarboxylase family protein [Bacteroidia bacterium]
MKFHKEGIPSLIITIIVAVIINILTHLFAPCNAIILWLGYLLSAFLLITILQFFRSPNRSIVINDNHIIAPADGKVVVIEEVVESEYFKDKRLQISIFMSPINVHVNRYPISGIVKYSKYHPGLFLVAWHPKSSTDNERTTIVVEHANGNAVLFRQIAGALARRIVNYSKEGDIAKQGDEFGFIKFGSRVDLLLPLAVKVNVKLEEVVKGRQTVIATFA